MSEILIGMIQYGDLYYLAFPIALLLLLIFLKGRRLRFILPAVLITVAISNPLFYRVWMKLGLYAYWRVLWLIPVIPVCAAVPCAVSEKLHSMALRLVIVILCMVAFIKGGTFLYAYTNGAENGSSAGGTFLVPAANAEKVPQTAAEIAKWLLARDENPRVVAGPEISAYLRQFSAKIDQLYGRDVDGFIYAAVSADARAVHTALKSPDGSMETVAGVMLNNGYDYLVVDNHDDRRRENLLQNGFILETQIADYGVYTAHGTPTLRKVRNELGQVVSVTTLDESGKPENGSAGYAMVTYEYDEFGNVIREFRTDTNGNGVDDGTGCAGWERVCNAKGHVLSERFLNPSGNYTENNRGLAETRREYQGNYLVRESYFDTEGCPASPTDRLYSSIISVRDEHGRVIEEHFYDAEGDPIRIPRGCAEIRRAYNEKNQKIWEEYYDENGDPAEQAAGYVAIEQEFDEAGNLVVRRYLGMDGKPVLRKDGFSEARWEKQDVSTVRNIELYSLDGNKIPLDGINLAKDVEADDGWSVWRTPRYNRENSTFTIGTVNLGEKAAGDTYTCQVEIEFSGVTATAGQVFIFQTQGEADGGWSIGNIWYPDLVKLTEAPEDGIYRFAATLAINEKMANASTFNIGFRCDNWASGAFRVRNVKIEKGAEATAWSPGI